MNKTIDYFLFIFGIVFIEIGFASYVLISLLTLEYGFNESRNNLLIAIGTILLILGIALMFLFTKESNKKKTMKKS
jgi:hypothetical protein